MESTVRIASGSEAEGRECRRPKRIKLNEVAEIVMVLAAMGKMRNGGVGLTDAELGMMEEAMEGLAGVCEDFAPCEVFPKAVFGSLIDDLGLNGLKDQKVGDCPPKLSISEKMLASKRKMEEAEKFSLPATVQSFQHLQGNFSSSPSQMAKLSNQTHTSGNFPSVGATRNSTSSPYQLPTSEMKPTVSAALPRAARPQIISNAVFALPAPANYSANSSMRTPSWPMHPHIQSSENGSGNEVPSSKPFKVASDREGLTPTETKVATTTVVAPRGTKHVHASLASRHSEIGKIIQKILQPKVPEYRTWVRPSNGYMSKALTCQICMANVTEINGVLVCDACEKGYHLKCLQPNNPIRDAAAAWHCRKCLSLNNVKFLAPKYGPVTKTMNASKKSSSNSAAVESNFGASHDVSQPAKIASTQNLHTAASTLSHQISASKPEVVTKIQDDNIGAGKVEADGKVSSVSSPNAVVNISEPACVLENSPVEIIEARSVELKLDSQDKLDTDSLDYSLGLLDNHDGEMVDLKSNTIAKLEVVSDSSNKSVTVTDIQDEDFNLPNDHNMRIEDSQVSESGEVLKLGSSLKQDRKEPHCNPSSDVLKVVNWVGDPVQDLKEKIYYVSCSINGHEYRVSDHVLIRFGNDKLLPSKLQTMWEDKATGQKWVTVNRYYFCGDLPETVGRPSGVQNNEVDIRRSQGAFAGI